MAGFISWCLLLAQDAPRLSSSPAASALPLRMPNLGTLSRLEWGAKVLASALPPLARSLLLAAWVGLAQPQPYVKESANKFAARGNSAARKSLRDWRAQPHERVSWKEQERERRILAAQQPVLVALSDARHALQAPLPCPNYGYALVRQGARLRLALEQMAAQVGWPAALAALERGRYGYSTATTNVRSS